MQNRIKEIANFQTYLGVLSDNSQVASIIFPSALRSNKYPNSYIVNEYTGQIKRKNNICYCVPNNTVKEATSVIFRLACHQNKNHLHTLTFEPGMLWGFEFALSEWLYALPTNCNKATIYGGEILNIGMLENICNVMHRHANKTMCIYTYNDEAVNHVRFKKLVPSNLLLYKSSEWEYSTSNNKKFNFNEFYKNKLIVPVNSINYKYYHEATNIKCYKRNKSNISRSEKVIKLYI